LFEEKNKRGKVWWHCLFKCGFATLKPYKIVEGAIFKISSTLVCPQIDSGRHKNLKLLELSNQKMPKVTYHFLTILPSQKYLGKCLQFVAP
jgi:hypothetical protein